MTFVQHFWRCAHHPIATQNFFERRATCEWECDTQALEWYHGGEHPLPPCAQKPFVPLSYDRRIGF
jgi:hypothetical protein